MLSRLRESRFLKENRLVPAALLVLAVGIFAWLLIPLWGNGEETTGEPVSIQPEISQSPAEPAEEDPAPDVENRNVASYAAFQSKDPFENVVERADATEQDPGAAGQPTDAPADGEALAAGTGGANGGPSKGATATPPPSTEGDGQGQDAGTAGSTGDGGRTGSGDDFSVLEAAEGEGRDDLDPSPGTGAQPGAGGVGGSSQGGSRDSFQNGGGVRGPSK